MTEAAIHVEKEREGLHVPGSRALLILALLLLLPAVLPLAAPGYFIKAHDARHSIFWIVEYDAALRDGAWWPVWAPDHALGFGYPVWLVYAPLAYTAAEVFHLLGLGFAAAAKATWALGFLLGALGTFCLARRWWGPAAALVAAVVYTYAPYHLVQIYVRADLAEFMAWAWFPWSLLAFVNLWEAPGPRRAGLAALALGALILLHTVSPLFFAPVLAAFMLVKLVEQWRAERRFPLRWFLWTLAAVGLGGLLVMVFLLPGLFELRYVVQAQFVGNNYNYLKQFVYLNQFFSPFWGFGAAVAGPDDGMGFQLGLLPLIAGAVGAWAALRAGRAGVARRRHLPHRTEAFLLAGLSVGSVLAMLPAAAPLWQALPLGDLIQFPWRLLALPMVTLALLAGAGVYWLTSSARPETEGDHAGLSPYPLILALVVVLASFPYTRPQLYPLTPADEGPLGLVVFEREYPDMRGITHWSQRSPLDSDSPLLAQYNVGLPLQRAAILTGDGVITAQSAAANSASAHVTARSSVRLRFYTYYFPGWQATVDGWPVTIQPDQPMGLIGLDLPPGEHDVRLRFGATPIRRAGGAISFAALVTCLFLTLHRKPFARSRRRML
ncbi:MAG TPA: hypothetical protein VGA61_13225 [Anaerolineae bacterium]